MATGIAVPAPEPVRAAGDCGGQSAPDVQDHRAQRARLALAVARPSPTPDWGGIEEDRWAGGQS